jgi:hypothetical protein
MYENIVKKTLLRAREQIDPTITVQDINKCISTVYQVYKDIRNKAENNYRKKEEQKSGLIYIPPKYLKNVDGIYLWGIGKIIIKKRKYGKNFYNRRQKTIN